MFGPQTKCGKEKLILTTQQYPQWTGHRDRRGIPIYVFVIKGLDGKDIHEVFVPRDTVIFTSLLCCNLDPDLWGPDASDFKPDRWLKPLPETVLKAPIPGVYANL